MLGWTVAFGKEEQVDAEQGLMAIHLEIYHDFCHGASGR